MVTRLRDLGVHQKGTIHIEQVSTWLSAEGHAAEDATAGRDADAVVWAQVVGKAYDDSELSVTYLIFMTLATVLAAIAIVLDSQILIVGAMVLGPEFVPIAALGLAAVRRRPGLFKQAFGTLLIGFFVSVGITMAAAMAARGLGWVDAAEITAPRPGTAFIYTPDKWSFIVAIIAAAAGVLSLTSERVGGLSGVFISVTTVPAAANIAVGLAFGLPEEITGSSLQLALNVTGMVIAGWLTLAIQQWSWGRHSPLRRLRVRR